MTNVLSPLLYICIYFCCHPHTELEALDEGILLRQSNQRELAVFYLLQLLLLLFSREHGSKFIKKLRHLQLLLLGVLALLVIAWINVPKVEVL